MGILHEAADGLYVEADFTSILGVSGEEEIGLPRQSFVGLGVPNNLDSLLQPYYSALNSVLSGIICRHSSFFILLLLSGRSAVTVLSLNSIALISFD